MMTDETCSVVKIYVDMYVGDLRRDKVSWTNSARSDANKHNSWDRYIRRPTAADAVGMHRLVGDTDGILDLNSTYSYLLMATDFAETSIVADRGGDLCGLITGYHPPARPEVLFVWQVAVATSARGTGLASMMLEALVHGVRCNRRGHPLTIETTVSPSNTPSRAMFGGFARRHGVPMTEEPWFSAAQLDASHDHEEEPLLRIGPIAAPLNE